MSFQDELDAICCKVARKVARDNKLTALSGSLDYWREEQRKCKEGRTYAILAPWIYTGEVCEDQR